MLRGERGGIAEAISELVDIVLIAIGFSLAIELYQIKNVLTNEMWPVHFVIFLIYLITWIMGSNVYKVYQLRRFMSMWRELGQMLKAHFFSFALSIILTNLYNPNLLRNRFFFYFGAFVVCLTIGVHIATRLMLQAWRKMGRNTRYVLILGGGSNGRAFKIYKFRSMVINAEELKERLAHLKEMSGPVFKITNDPRVTAVGRFIRKTSIDELPQLINVFKGNMRTGDCKGMRPEILYWCGFALD